MEDRRQLQKEDIKHCESAFASRPGHILDWSGSRAARSDWWAVTTWSAEIPTMNCSGAVPLPFGDAAMLSEPSKAA